MNVREWLEQGPFTLGLSAGFFGFYAHAGVLAALTDAGFVPQAVAGASAGALVGGLYAGGVAPAEIGPELLSVARSDFWDPRPGRGLLQGRRFDRVLRRFIGDARLEDCETPAALSVYSVNRRATVVPRQGDLATIIRASCAVPVMFHPVVTDGDKWLDGGILDRHGLAGVAPPTRVLHHHLSSRSPWRSAKSHQLAPPERANTFVWCIDGLPRVHPFAMERGRDAFEQARDWAQAALSPTE